MSVKDFNIYDTKMHNRVYFTQMIAKSTIQEFFNKIDNL